MKHVTQAFALVLLCLVFNSCLKYYYEDTDTVIDQNNQQQQQGQIYYKLYIDLTYPSGNGATSCNIAPGNFVDNNPAVPDQANFNQFYGPSQAGTFSATFVWDLNASQPHYMNYNYTLEEPPTGYRRYYTHTLIDYDPSLNRCLFYATTPGYLTYRDEKI